MFNNIFLLKREPITKKQGSLTKNLSRQYASENRPVEDRVVIAWLIYFFAAIGDRCMKTIPPKSPKVLKRH